MNSIAYSCPESLISDTNALISLPEVCLQLRERLADPQHTRKEVARIILHDPALTARVLRIVNSAHYSLPQKVNEISHALNILGEEELQNLVIVTSIVKTMAKVSSTVDIRSFWRSSVFSAVMAKNLKTHSQTDTSKAEDLFIAGLLLNIGRLLLYHHEPALLEEVGRKMRADDLPDYVVERDMLGFDHADVGASMATSWNFSPELVECIRCHHRPIEELQSKTHAIMGMTAFFTDQFDFVRPKQVELDKLQHERQPLLDTIDLDWQEFCVIVNNSYEDYLHAHEAFCGA